MYVLLIFSYVLVTMYVNGLKYIKELNMYGSGHKKLPVALPLNFQIKLSANHSKTARTVPDITTF